MKQPKRPKTTPSSQDPMEFTHHPNDFMQDTMDGLTNFFVAPVRGILEFITPDHPTPPPEPKTQRCLTYENVLEYAIQKQQQYTEIQSTLLNITPLKRGLEISQVFSDSQGDLIRQSKGYLGRKLIVQTLDPELLDILDGDSILSIDLPTIQEL